MARRWTAAEDALLIELYLAGIRRERIAQRLGRSSDAIDARRRYLSRPARTIPPRRWTQPEDAFLRAAAAARIPSSEIAIRLNRTAYAVRRRREIIGVAGPPSRLYSAHEDALIADVITQCRPLALLASQLGRSEGALRLHAKHLGLLESPPRRCWTTKDDIRLRSGYISGLSVEEIKQRLLPERSKGSIVARAHLLGLAEHGRRWTSQHDDKLSLLVQLGLSSTYIARQLGRTEDAITKRCRLLGLQAPPPDPPQRGGAWTAEEDDLLRARIDEPVGALASALRRSRASIRRRRHALGLPVPARSQHHPLSAGPVHAQERTVACELPLTPRRALAVAKRLRMPLADVRRLANSRT